MTLIAVEGSALRSHRAEIARVHVGVSREGAERRVVLDRATEIHARLVEQLKRHAADGAVDTWDSRSVHAYTYTDWRGKKDKWVEKFRASASVSADFTDIEVLSRWLPEVAELDGVSVGGVDWDLTRETRDRLLTEVRSGAARETRARAAAYAEAMGLGEPRMVALYESGLRPGLGGGGGGYGMPMMAAAAPRGAAGGAEPPRFELEPPELDVRVSVTADYEA